MKNRFDDAWFIQHGACNVTAIARSLRIACIEASRETNDNPAKDPAVRMIVHQLAHLIDYHGLDNNLHEYSKLYKILDEERNKDHLRIKYNEEYES